MEIVVKTFLLIVMLNNSIDCKYLYNECGEVPVTSTINNGYKVEPHRYPWQVWIIDDEGGEFCGGSVITENHVMTAAHCLYNKSVEENFIYVTVRTHDTDKVIEDFVDYNMDDIIEISDIKLYPGYNEAHDFNKTSDVAILTLNQTLRKR